MMESFTIQTGLQLKTTYNVRLMVSNIVALFKEPRSPEEEEAFRKQTMMTLYSHELSGVVILLTAKSFEKHVSGIGSNAGCYYDLRSPISWKTRW